MVAVGRDEHLGLVAQAAEGDRMDDPVTITLEGVARPARPVGALGVGPASRSLWLRGKVPEQDHFVAIFSKVMPSGAV